MRRQLRYVGLILALALPCSAVAVDVGKHTKPTRAANFVNLAQIDVISLVAPPPKAGSTEEKAEFATLHKFQDARTPDRVQIANDDYTETAFAVIRDDLGPAFKAEKLPITAAFLKKVQSDEGLVVDPAKDHWARPRPPLVDATLTPCKPVKNTGAYPSGHGTLGYLTAIVVSDMVPEKREVVFGSAARFAESRLICAVHYPSDLQAAKVVAAVMAQNMQTNPNFRKEFAAAKAELRHALGLGK